jgi:hypothetical protein
LAVEVAGGQRFENAAVGNSLVAWTLAIDSAQLGGQALEVGDFSFNVLQVLRGYLVDAGAVALTLKRKPQELAHMIERKA